MLTQERLKEVLSYNPTTGVFVRKASRNGWPVGGIAGNVDKNGYVIVRIGSKAYKAHRLAWLYVNGRWPKDQIDHIDMVKTNNAWVNLREASTSQNKANMSKRADNTTGWKGVVQQKRCKTYVAQITKNGKTYQVGRSVCPAVASFMYQIEADKVHMEFARGT